MSSSVRVISNLLAGLGFNVKVRSKPKEKVLRFLASAVPELYNILKFSNSPNIEISEDAIEIILGQNNYAFLICFKNDVQSVFLDVFIPFSNNEIYKELIVILKRCGADIEKLRKFTVFFFSSLALPRALNVFYSYNGHSWELSAIPEFDIRYLANIAIIDTKVQEAYRRLGYATLEDFVDDVLNPLKDCFRPEQFLEHEPFLTIKKIVEVGAHELKS